MTALQWGVLEEKYYETGVSRGVLNPVGDAPAVWNGLVSVTENVSGGEAEAYYYDGIKYMDVIMNEDYQATLEVFNTPAAFDECSGMRQLAPGLFVTQQIRKPFGLTWRTEVGNGITETAGYKLHLLWNCTVSPSEKVSRTISEDVNLETRSWTINTVPPAAGLVEGQSYKPTAHMMIDSRYAPPYLADLEVGLYGDSEIDPFWPSQQQVINMMTLGVWDIS